MIAGVLERDGEANVARDIPLGRIGEPEDVAGAAVYLASDASAFVTGHVLSVNGGQWMG
jgi:NAD(P)-dependent dehydrogenase (short-subunit alcohol dehydrogenase family)